MRHALIPLAICVPLWCAAPAVADGAGLQKPMSAEQLATYSGGANPTIGLSYQALTASNSGNSIDTQSLVTGTVTLQAGSFSGFNGVGNFVINTGNNNNLQGALSVTVMVPAVN
jgi:hypothetical protein